MAAVKPIDRDTPSSSDKEAAKVLALHSQGGLKITGPAAPTNSLQYSGTAVSGGTRISGGNGSASLPKSERIPPVG